MTFNKTDIDRWLELVDKIGSLGVDDIPEFNDITELLAAVVLMSEYILEWGKHDRS